MKKIIIAIAIAISAIPALAANTPIFTCSNMKGEGYYPNRGLITAKDAGWHQDGIKDGLFSLYKIKDTEYDILYVDASKQVISSVNDGGNVVLLGSGNDYMTVLVNYPGKSVETYFFYKTSAGQNEVLYSQTKYSTPISKSVLFRGTCSR